MSGTERKDSYVSSGRDVNDLNLGSLEARDDSATTDWCFATQPVTPSPIFMRMFPISPVCGSCEAQSTISALDDSSKYTRQASQFVTLTTSPISSFSIFFKDMSELTIPLTRCNKASCDRAESGEFTSVAFIGFSPPPERPRLSKRIAS